MYALSHYTLDEIEYLLGHSLGEVTYDNNIIISTTGSGINKKTNISIDLSQNDEFKWEQI